MPWKVLPAAYDDGGFSGGSIDRPGLRALLADVAAGRIDVVVVYKVDRLTRSLADFAKIVGAFDAHGVSFVSVTQAFNTTTSMGRLTLNVFPNRADLAPPMLVLPSARGSGGRAADPSAETGRRGYRSCYLRHGGSL